MQTRLKPDGPYHEVMPSLTSQPADPAENREASSGSSGPHDSEGSGAVRVLKADALTGLQSIANAAVQDCLTSPPFYLLRRYGTSTSWPDGWTGELGHESHPNDFVRHLLCVFDEAWRVLRDDGCLWVNLGDTFNNKQGKKGTTNAPDGSNCRFAAAADMHIGSSWPNADACTLDADRCRHARLRGGQADWAEAFRPAEPERHADTSPSRPMGADKFRRLLYRLIQ